KFLAGAGFRRLIGSAAEGAEWYGIDGGRPTSQDRRYGASSVELGGEVRKIPPDALDPTLPELLVDAPRRRDALRRVRRGAERRALARDRLGRAADRRRGFRRVVAARELWRRERERLAFQGGSVARRAAAGRPRRGPRAPRRRAAGCGAGGLGR